MNDKASDDRHRSAEMLNEELRALCFSTIHVFSQSQSAKSSDMVALVGEVGAMFVESFQVILGKVSQTLSEGKMHSWRVGAGGRTAILTVYTLPCTYEGARAWLAQGSPPTYTELLANICTGSVVTAMREMGARVLVHMLICADPDGSPLGLHLCIFPFAGSGPGYRIVLPWDLLSADERRDWESHAAQSDRG